MLFHYSKKRTYVNDVYVHEIKPRDSKKKHDKEKIET